MNNEQKRISLLTITLVASLGGFLFGFDIVVVSGVMPLLNKQFALTSSETGLFVSSALIGCIIGVLLSGEISDRLGRKKPLLITAALFGLSAIGCAIMPSLPGVTISRLIGGIGIGIASNIVPLYISEIAPAAIRGRLVTYYQFALTFGILVAFLSNAALLKAADPTITSGLASIFNAEVWRGMLAVGIIPSILFFIGLLMVPESPRWLFGKGRTEEGVAIISSITGQSATDIHIEQSKIKTPLEKASYKELFAPNMRRALLIGIMLPLFSQFSGINAIMYYGPSILSAAGVSVDNALLGQIVFGVANMLFTLIAVWKVDSWGRRPLYLYGTAGATIALVLTGICFYFGATQSIWTLVCLLGFLACFAFSIGPLKFVVASEIFPNAIRGRALAISIMVMWIADTIVGYVTPILLEQFGSSVTFWVYGAFCAIAFVFVYKLLPETKGKSLEEIENDWKEKEEAPLILH
jgi:SP family arabinose:H+ symporter-like MFS transporter